MKRIMLIFCLIILENGPLAAQDSVPPSSPEPLMTPSSSLGAPSVSLDDKQQELRDLERQLNELRKQMGAQTTQRRRSSVGISKTLPQSNRTNIARSHIVLGGMHISSPDLLVVPGPNSPRQIDVVLEDMRIMTRILEKELKEYDLVKPQVFTPWDSGKHGIEGLYLDGYGLVFQLAVEFPLRSLGDEQKPDGDEEEPGDRVWHETRQEIFEPDRQRHKEQEKQEEYDPDRVDSLIATISETLRHASNIRALKENECVAVIVISRLKAGDGIMTMYGDPDEVVMGLGGGYGGYGGDYGGGMGGMMGGWQRSRSASGSSVLTLKAKKGDIDALAQEKIDLDQFRSKLQTMLY
ncbi:hypothetical protein ACFL6U_18495 [Planctomycetota bacterium]